MVVIVILGMIAVLLIFSTQLGDSATHLNQQLRLYAGRENNYMVARSAFDVALALLEADDEDTDGPSDFWATGPQVLDWEGRHLRLEIQDEERRIPLRAMLPAEPSADAQFQPSDEQRAMTEVLGRLLKSAGQPELALNSLVDWMDADSISLPGGGEVTSDPRIPVKNAPVDALSELRFIRGWGTPSLPPPVALSGYFDQSLGGSELALPEESRKSGAGLGKSTWEDWLTVAPCDKININTAPRAVLEALDVEMSGSVVSDIISKRGRGSLENEQDLTEIAGINADMAFRLGRLIRYNSQHFRIRVVVEEQPGRLALEALVKRKDDEMEVLSWRVR